MTPPRSALTAIAVAIAWVLAWSGTAAAYTAPKLTGRVVDPGNMLGGAAPGIEFRLEKVARARGYELVVFIPQTLEGATIEDVAYAAFNTWHLGQAGKDTGVLLVIAPAARAIRIETGKGAGGAITDLQSYQIIQRIGPLVANGRTADAVVLAIDELDRLLVKDGAQASPRAESESSWWLWGFVAGFLALAILLFAKLGFRRGGSAVWSVFQVAAKIAEVASSSRDKKKSSRPFKGGGGSSGGGGASGSY